MLPSDLSDSLEKLLRPADVRGSGAAICRRLRAKLGVTVGVQEIRRIGGRRDVMLLTVKVADDGWYGTPYFVSLFKGRVSVLPLLVDGQGAYSGPWRRAGNEIVGELDLIQGNWTTPCLYQLKRTVKGWVVRTYREFEHESRGARFVGRGLHHLVVTARSYEFQVFNQPHAGPLLLRDSDCYVHEGRISVERSELRRTPLYDFDQFVASIQEGDFAAARQCCAPGLFSRVRRYVKDHSYQKGQWHVTCPYSYEIDDSKILGLWAGREETREFLSFRRSGAGWKIVGFRRLESLPKPRWR